MFAKITKLYSTIIFKLLRILTLNNFESLKKKSYNVYFEILQFNEIKKKNVHL